ncbi:MAG: hypothetical protein Q8K59_05800 [Nitrosomonas sp.]|nr:hypothetical protein [Nitrosomonas sp.]MDP1950596.1 hypothetical protein [Nitrosomonas sp.]
MADAKGLYSHHVRKQWQSIQGSRYHYGYRDGSNRILKIYALCWGIEIYFKESKRHLGLS